MIPDIPLVLISIILELFAILFGVVGTFLQIPLMGFQNALVYFFGQLYYFAGVIDVPATLNFFGEVMGLVSVLFIIWLVEWILHHATGH